VETFYVLCFSATSITYLVVVVVVLVVVELSVIVDALVVSIAGAVAAAAFDTAAVSEVVVVDSSFGLLLQAVRTTIEVTTNAKNTFFISLIFG
jgi:hypothetical protein